MKINSNEFECEKKYLEKTKDIIRKNIDKKVSEINEYKKMIVSNKRHLWQNLNDYRSNEMYSTMREEDLNVTILNAEIIKVSKLERSLEKPFFGRIDFESDSEKESIYLGITGIEDNYKHYVYDWRAPISNLYYNYGLGSASFETESGTIYGNITLKRQYKIEMGELLNAFDSEITIEDEMLQEVLLSSSDDKMKNIVSTIQKEQNEVIRYNGIKNLVIEGIAGSGKTSVAMHRIAYLLYNQKNLTNKNVLIFSPNDIFTNYISNVLPELGEDNVNSITKDKLFKIYLPKYKIESLSKFIETFYKSESELDKSISYKFNDDYIKDLDIFITEYISQLEFTKKIGLKTIFVESDELNKMFKENARKLNLNDKLNYMALKLCDRFDVKISNSKTFENALSDMLNIDKDPIKIYKKFLKDDSFASDGVIPYEDLTGMMYLYFEINGYPSYSYIKHIIIDEAQDYSPLEFKLFKNIYNSAVFTILGDKNQAINPYFKYNTLEIVSNIFEDCKYMRLLKTYRSSSEIIEFTNKILGINDIESVRISTGIEVSEKQSMNIIDLKSDIEDLMNTYKRIAVITKTFNDAKFIFEQFHSKDIGFITEGLLKRVVIIPSYLSKGLEFDAVIVYQNKNNRFNENELNLYYVAATRAQHKLIVYN